MKHLQKLLPLLFLVAQFFPTTTFASTDDDYTFTIHIGAFVKAKLADFKTIRPFGYLYAENAENNLTRIYMSDYETEAQAYQTLKQVKVNGYPDAFVTRKKMDRGPAVRVIQIGVEPVGADINWLRYNKAGKLQTILQGQQVKIVSGPYKDLAEAQSMLKAVRNTGFKDAFVKKVNKTLLHPVTSFEANMELEDVVLSPVEEEVVEEEVLVEKTVPVKKSGPNLMVKSKKKASEDKVVIEEAMIPESYDEVVLTEKSVSPVVEKPISIALPQIRKNVKRTSVLELQKVLKKEKVYKSSLDGYYGKGTAGAWANIKSNNREFRKYRLLAKHREEFSDRGTSHILQYYIDNLYQEPSKSVAGLKNAKEAIAKAYRAYYLFVHKGDQQEIDRLMNSAIQTTFSKNKKLKNKPPFDYTATYTYANLDQLILHLRYIQGASNDGVATPAWLFQKHPKETMKAFEARGNGDYKMANADAFFQWEELQLLQVIAEDLATKKVASKTITAAQSKRARLLMAPKVVDTSDQIYLEGWNRSLWNGLDAWGEKDPVLARIAIPLKVCYYQSQVRLEDYFMTKGFKPKEASHLALATLQTIVDPYLADL